MMKKLLAILLAMLMMIAPCAIAEEDDDIRALTPTEAMQPLMDSVMRVIMENAGNYDPQSSDYVWSVLYLFGVNYGLEYPGTALEDGTYDILIPGGLIREAAAAAFPSLTALPEMPVVEGTTFGYNAETDTYVMPGSDVGDTTTEVYDLEKADDDSLSLTLKMIDMDEEVVAEMGFVLAPNAEGKEFPYTITSVK